MNFASQITAAERRTEKELLDKWKRAIIIAGEMIIDRTAVDTGLAKGSWKGSRNKINDSLGIPDGSGSRAKALLRKQVSLLKLVDDLFLTNSVPYILHLEFGTSKAKAQSMIMPVAVMWPAIFRRA